MSHYTEPTWRTRPEELEPDPDDYDPCGALACKLRQCDGECPESVAFRARAAEIEALRLAELARKAVA